MKVVDQKQLGCLNEKEGKRHKGATVFSFNANWCTSPQSTEKTYRHGMNTIISQTRTHCSEKPHQL